MNKVFTIFLYLVLVATFLFSVALVVPAYQKYLRAKSEVSDLSETLDRRKQESQSLSQEIHDLEHKASAIEKVAREKFRYCREGEQIFLYNQ